MKHTVTSLSSAYVAQTYQFLNLAADNEATCVDALRDSMPLENLAEDAVTYSIFSVQESKGEYAEYLLTLCAIIHALDNAINQGDGGLFDFQIGDRGKEEVYDSFSCLVFAGPCLALFNKTHKHTTLQGL